MVQRVFGISLEALGFFLGGGGLNTPQGTTLVGSYGLYSAIWGGGGTVAIDKSKILSAEQITANLHAIYDVLCWSLCQVNAKYSPQILTNLS